MVIKLKKVPYLHGVGELWSFLSVFFIFLPKTSRYLIFLSIVIILFNKKPAFSIALEGLEIMKENKFIQFCVSVWLKPEWLIQKRYNIELILLILSKGFKLSGKLLATDESIDSSFKSSLSTRIECSFSLSWINLEKGFIWLP